jgi:hypothetical protein
MYAPSNTSSGAVTSPEYVDPLFFTVTNTLYGHAIDSYVEVVSCDMFIE